MVTGESAREPQPTRAPPRRAAAALRRVARMLDDIVAELSANPLASIFVLTLVTTLILRKLYQMHVSLQATTKDS